MKIEDLSYEELETRVHDLQYEIEDVILGIKSNLPSTRATSLAITKLDEAWLWLSNLASEKKQNG